MKNSTLFTKAILKGLKIEYLDIETSPLLIRRYGTNKAYVHYDQIIEPTKITSAVILSEQTRIPTIFSWDWTGDLILNNQGVSGGGEDKNFLTELGKRINNADLVIMQNGDRFDIPVLQNRLLELNLSPLKNIITIDTLKLSRKSFNSPSHSLDFQIKQVGGSGKIKQDMEDCIKVAHGNIKAQNLRIKYNIKDVVDLRKIFWKRMNYYIFPLKTLNMLKTFIKEKRIFCIKCSARRQKKFEIKRIKVKGVVGGKWECQNCFYNWKMKKGEWDIFVQFNSKPNE